MSLAESAPPTCRVSALFHPFLLPFPVRTHAALPVDSKFPGQRPSGLPPSPSRENPGQVSPIAVLRRPEPAVLSTNHPKFFPQTDPDGERLSTPLSAGLFETSSLPLRAPTLIYSRARPAIDRPDTT